MTTYDLPSSLDISRSPRPWCGSRGMFVRPDSATPSGWVAVLPCDVRMTEQLRDHWRERLPADQQPSVAVHVDPRRYYVVVPIQPESRF